MRFVTFAGTRRPFAILAWILLPLAALALGASAWQSWRLYLEHSSQHRAEMKVAAEEGAIGRTAQTVQLPTELSPINSINVGGGQPITCETNVSVIGCWSSPKAASVVAHELSLAMTRVGLRHAVTRCSVAGCLTGASLPSGDGELVFDVFPLVDGAAPAASPCEIQAVSWPRDLYITDRFELYGGTAP